MPVVKRAFLPACLALIPLSAQAEPLPLIDAHSQFDDVTPVAQVLDSAARAGVSRVLLSARGGVEPADVAALAERYPECIVASARTKGSAYAANRKGYYRMLDEELANPAFRAMSEIIVVHARKGQKAPQVVLAASAPQVQEAIRRGIAKGWPVVLHYELRWLGSAAERIAEIESLLAAHPGHPFALIHMAQLGPDEAARLLAAHPNLHFLTSHANSIADAGSRQPWTNMFDGEALKPEWQALMVKYPERFVLAFDNVWYTDWSEHYAAQAALWRKALGGLPPQVAHAVAHGNAERLWKLPPALAGSGCAALKY